MKLTVEIEDDDLCTIIRSVAKQFNADAKVAANFPDERETAAKLRSLAKGIFEVADYYYSAPPVSGTLR